MAALSALYKYVLPAVPGCPELTLDFNILQAAIEFMRETSVYTITVPAFPIVAGTASYSHGVVTDLQLNRVIDAAMNGIYPGLSLMPNAVVLPSQTAQLPTTMIPGDDNLSFQLWPTPSVAGTLGYRYSAFPTQTATTIPDVIIAQWGDAIATGAKARILDIPDKPYTNEKAASDFLTKFRALIDRARITRQAGFVAGARRVQYQPFGN